MGGFQEKGMGWGFSEEGNGLGVSEGNGGGGFRETGERVFTLGYTT